MHFKKYQAFCFDLDGTVYKGDEPISEAVLLIRRLQETGLNPYFVTNNSSSTQLAVQSKLHSFGLKVRTSNIMTSAIAAARYCATHFGGASVMMIGETGLEEALQSVGMKITNVKPDVVVIGIDREVSYVKLSDACLAIASGAHFIATNGDKAIPTERGLEPGNGSFVKLVENATGVKPVFIGKPESHMLSYIQENGGYKKEEMVMIGDNYDTDIMAGIHFGIDTVFVEGGVTSMDELKKKKVQPSFVLRTLADYKV